MDDGKPNETDTDGKEVNSTPKENIPPTSPPIEPQPISPLLDRAEAANKEKAVLLEREEKLTERREKLHALQMVGGHTVAGQVPEKPKEIEDRDYAKKAIAGEFNDKKI